VVYNEALANRLRGILHGRPGVEEKKMFGGLSFMVDGQMCCGVLKDDLVLRISAEEFDEALSHPHVRPFDFSGRPMVGMLYVAADGVSNDKILREWVQRGLDYVRDHPKTEARAARKRK
jgi:TfoX/Sxy family transcriptional regulator of competence genes